MMSISGLYCDNAIANLSSCSMFRILAFLSPERRLLFYFQVYSRKTHRITMKGRIVAKPTSKLKIEAMLINYLSIVYFESNKKKKNSLTPKKNNKICMLLNIS